VTQASNTLVSSGSGLKYSDGIAAARTMIALEGNADALQRRLPSGWELAPYAGDDLRGTSLRGANMLVPFHEIYAVRTHEGKPTGLPQVSYVVFISQARNQATGALGHFIGFFTQKIPRAFQVSIGMASSPTSRGRKPSLKSDAARPKFVKLSLPWLIAERCICLSPIGKVAR
jgi:hypothetical protein